MNIAEVDLVTEVHKGRSYDSPARRTAAERTRRRILAAAHKLFTAQGYADTSVAQIARRARVSVDTVYTAVGRKPQLLLAVHDMILASGPVPLPTDQRDYVQAITAATSARDKLQIYADALGALLPGTAPLMNALKEAGATDPACRTMWESISNRRAANMLQFAADLRTTGEIRDDLSDQQIAELVWSTNSAEFYTLVASRGTTPTEFSQLLSLIWTGALLRS